MNEYLTLEQFKAYRDAGGANASTKNDALITSLLATSSRFINEFCGRSFHLRFEGRYYDHPIGVANQYTLDYPATYPARIHSQPFYMGGLGVSELPLDDDLLEITELLTNNEDTTIDAADYFLMCGRSYTLRPANKIVLNYNSNDVYWDFNTTPQRANKVSGWWGYNNEYPNVFTDSSDALTGDIDDSVTTVSVTDPTEADEFGVTPRLSAMQTIKINDELMYIVSVTGSDLTVKRGINGTTAVAHTSGDSVYVYVPMGTIVNAARRLTNWLYTQKDSLTDNDRPILTQAGVTILPNQIPNDITLSLIPYKSVGGSSGIL